MTFHQDRSDAGRRGARRIDLWRSPKLAMPGLGLAIALVVMTAADQAGAAVTVFRWSGYVEGGTDTGVYLTSGGDLTGLKFTTSLPCLSRTALSTKRPSRHASSRTFASMRSACSASRGCPSRRAAERSIIA